MIEAKAQQMVGSVFVYVRMYAYGYVRKHVFVWMCIVYTCNVNSFVLQPLPARCVECLAVNDFM